MCERCNSIVGRSSLVRGHLRQLKRFAMPPRPSCAARGHKLAQVAAGEQRGAVSASGGSWPDAAPFMVRPVQLGDVPRIETARLTLREWRAADADAYAALGADPQVTRYVGGVMNREQSWRSMALHAGHWALHGYGHWVVERTSDGEFLGRAGLWSPDASGWPGIELGWTFARHAWGNGYATEAADAAMRWAWAVLKALRLISVIHPENTASRRVAERSGLVFLRDEELSGSVVSIFGIERPTEPASPGSG
jgi:RimJ/RimL family protein N-acetyltransferase